jgi:hypothetical protein
MRRGIGVLLLAAWVGGCGDVSGAGVSAPTAPAAQRQAEGGFLERAAGAPEFGVEVVAIEARAGVAASDTLRFANGEPYVALHLDAATMRGATLRGAPVTEVRITLARASHGRFVAELQPSGLRFNPAAPARITFFHRHAAPRRSAALQLWRQERDDAPWERVGGLGRADERAFTAPIDGFTKYAVASGN